MCLEDIQELSDGKIVLTRQGYEEMQRELTEMLTVKRPANVNRIREALQLGDLKENFDYHDAKQQQGLIEARIRDLKAILDNAEVVDACDNNGCINVGSKVIVKDLDEGYEDEYMIVGAAESDPAEGKISHESCVGKALMGKSVGDTIEVDTPGGALKYEVISVN